MRTEVSTRPDVSTRTDVSVRAEVSTRAEVSMRADVTLRAEVTLRTERTGWRDVALCHGDLAGYFFPPSHFERKPEKDRRESVARALCHRCPAREACLEYAIAVREPHGIWGGLNELERRRMLRRLDVEARTA